MSPNRRSSEPLPDTLVEMSQWVCWREQDRDGDHTKVPIDPSTGRYASTTDPETWGSFEDAVAYAETGDAAGIGFVFTDDDPVVGVDLDDCRDPDSGEADPWAAEIIEQLDSYTEVSPSGTGFHVLVRGELPAGRNRHGDIECYDTARFFTVTGDRVGLQQKIVERTDALVTVHGEHVQDDDAMALAGDSNTDLRVQPQPPEQDPQEHSEPTTNAGPLSDEELLSRAENAANGAKFSRLWQGTTSGYDSHSEADMALACLLAFWTGGDRTRMDELFRDSGLMRDKWDEIHYADGTTYGETTIDRALARTSEFYDPQPESDEDSDPAGAAETAGAAAAPPAAGSRTPELVEMVEQNRDLAERVAALEALVERHAEQIDDLERRLREREATDSGGETSQVAPAASIADVTSSEPDEDGEEDESADSFLQRATRFMRPDSD